MTGARRRVEVNKLGEGRSAHADVARLSAAERILMMWPLAVDAWAFKGEDVANRPMRRDVVRVIRRGG